MSGRWRGQGGLRTDVHSRAGGVTVALRGELDLHEARGLEEIWRKLGERGDLDVVVLDLSDLDLIDSSGIAFVLHVHGDCRRQGRDIVIVRPPEPVLHRFEATGIAEHLEMVDRAP
jgi:anti-anti-sigma factor